MNREPRVTCIVPVWNGERYLAAAIESLLAQTRPLDEILVIDDGSTDSTPEILKSFGDAVRVVRQDHVNTPRAHNTGISECAGDLVTFCDSDDLLTPDAIASRITLLLDDQTIDVVFGSCEQFVSPELPAEIAARFRYPAGPVSALVSGTMIARRDVFHRFGCFDETLRAGSFIQWLARARAEGLRIDSVDSLVLRRRLHATNMSLATGREGNRDLLAVVRDYHRRHGRQRDEAAE